VTTAAQLEAFLRRPWSRLRVLKDRHHAERTAIGGPDEAFRVAELLRGHARAMGAVETAAARRADLEAAISLRKKLDRASRRLRRAR
jgi:hypothetical protein